MANNPKAIGDHLNAIIAGWGEHAAAATFSGLTLAEFKQKVQPSLAARAEIEELDRQRNGKRVDRNNADVVSEEVALSVVNSVKGDLTYGENSPLYASFGYILKSERKSGLTRATNVVPVPTALKAAA